MPSPTWTHTVPQPRDRRQLALRWCGVPTTVNREDLAVLDARGRARAAAIVNDAVRARHVTAWALLRRLLAEVGGGDPAGVSLTVDQDRRPSTGTRTSVSISHTRDLVVVAACLDGPVGVDVERRDRQPLPPPSAWCSPAEVAIWSALPTADRALWQVRAWTAKEAVTKACGVGRGARLVLTAAATTLGALPLAAPPGTVGPSPRADRPSQVRWFDPTGDHVVAVAV
jgi:phosphopantetheinyl transferase